MPDTPTVPEPVAPEAGAITRPVAVRDTGLSPAMSRVLRDEQATLTGRLSDAFGADNMVARLPEASTEIGRLVFGMGFDPEFQLTGANLSETADRHGIPAELRASFFEAAEVAVSAEHLNELGAEFRRQSDRRARLGEDGLLPALGYSAVAIMLDPLIAIPGIGAANTIRRFVSGASSTAGAAGRAGLVGAGAGASQEALLGVGDPTRNLNDVWIGGAAGLTLGAGFGAAGRLLSGSVRAGDANLVRAREALNDPARAATASIGDRPLAAVAREDYGVEVDLDIDIPQHRSAGAAARSGGNDPLSEEIPILESASRAAGDVPSPESHASKLRIDSLSTLMKSASARVRALGAALFPEHVESNFVQRQTAVELQHAIDRSMRRAVKVETRTAFPEWAASRGIPKWRVKTGLANREFEEFTEEVSTFIRSGDTSVSEQAQRVGRVLQSRLGAYLERGKRAGVFDESIPDNPNYLPRIFNEAKLQSIWANTRLGEDAVRRLIQVAVKRATPFIDDEVAGAVAKAYVKRIRAASYGLSRSLMYGISLDDEAVLRDLLGDAGLGAVDIERMLGTVRMRNETIASIPRAKRRLDLDETASIQVDGYGELRVTDLLENNVDVLFDKYSRRVSGAIALKEKLGIVGSAAERDRLRKEIFSELEEHGVPLESIRRQADVAEAFIRRIAGIPIENTDGLFGNHPLSISSRITEGARRFNFATYMVQAGFASVAEFGVVAAKGGWSVLTHGIPHFRTLMRDARTGRLEDEFIDFFEEYLGEGADNLLHPLFSRFDDFTADAIDERQLSRLERGLNMAQHLVAEKISGLGPMTRFQRRLAMLGILRQIEGWALRGAGELTDAQVRRLNQAGLTARDLNRIKAGMQRHGITMQSSYRNRTFTRTDLQAWADADPTTFAKLMNAIGRESRRSIIEGEISDAPLWMQSRVGKIASQFMTFAINAHTKLMLRGFALHDIEVALGMLYSMGFAGAAYAVQQYVNTIGRPDARERAFETDRVIKNMLARAGPAALLPQVTDLLARTTGFDPVFDARGSGLPSGAIQSIPTVQTFDNAWRVLGAAANIRDDRQFSREQLRAASSLIPVVGRMVGSRAMFDALAEDLPRETVVGERR